MSAQGDAFATYTTLDVPGATRTYAYGIDGGNIVGWYGDYGGIYGFSYDGTTYTTLDVPGATMTYAYGIDGGNIVGYYWDATGNDHGFLMLIAASPGDANFDGIVDVADLGIVGANFNATDMQWDTGDFNLDGMTDVADLGILGANWTAAQAAGSAAALVPEPTTLSLLAMSVLMVGRRRR